jgi:hypothetical protein
VEICTALTHSFFVQLNDVISGNNALHMVGCSFYPALPIKCKIMSYPRRRFPQVFEWVDGQDICFEIVRRAAAGFIYR